jgi:hypothetical protein
MKQNADQEHRPQLAGTLDDFSVVDLIQLLSLGSKTGAALVQGVSQHRPVKGCIFFSNGAIHRAELGDLSGEEAVYSLLALTEGTFTFSKLAQLPPPNVRRSNESLILGATLHRLLNSPGI